MIEKIVSGGQTGVDQAALEAAINLDIPYGGWCPKGRLSESGIIPEKYSLLKETASSEYSERTKLNIRDSDGTLILVAEELNRLSDGTVLTIQEVKDKNKPFLVIDLTKKQDINAVINWAKENDIKVLNVAGPRESTSPGIHQLSLTFLETVLPVLVNKLP